MLQLLTDLVAVSRNGSEFDLLAIDHQPVTETFVCLIFQV